MKKSLLFLLLFILHIAAFAQHKPRITVSQLHYATGTTTMFGIPEMDKDLCIKKLINFLGTLAVNTCREHNREHLNLEGLDTDAKLQVRDGVTTRNIKNKSECWSAFDNEADKQRRLADLNTEQQRDMSIVITDQNGKDIVNSKEEEEAVKVF